MQLQEKINALNFWLMCNPTHPNYPVILKDKLELENQIHSN